MEVEVSQSNGLTLSIFPSPGSEGDVITARLTGTKFQAEVTVGNEASDPDAGTLAAFLTNAASVKAGEPLDWLSLCQDLAFNASIEPEFGGLVLLRVYMGSTSNDECAWQVNASLLLQTKQLRSFAAGVPVPHN